MIDRAALGAAVAELRRRHEGEAEALGGGPSPIGRAVPPAELLGVGAAVPGASSSFLAPATEPATEPASGRVIARPELPPELAAEVERWNGRPAEPGPAITDPVEAVAELRRRRDARLLEAIAGPASAQLGPDDSARLVERLADLPVTRDLADRPDFLPLVVDDLEGLGGVELWLKQAGRELVPQFRAGLQADRLGELAFRQMQGGELTAAERATLEAGIDAGQPDTLPGNSANLLGSMAPMIGEALLGGLAGATAFGLAGAAATGGPGAGPGAVAGAGFGGMTAALEKSRRVNAGFAWLEFGQFQAEDGAGLDPGVRRVAAELAGLLSGGLDTVAVGFLASKVPGVRDLTADGARAMVRRLLERPTFRAALLDFGKGWAGGIVAETATETAQELVQITVGELAKVIDPGEFAAITGAEVLERLGETAAHTARGMVLLALPGPALGFVGDVRRAREAAGQRDAFLALGDTVQGAKLRQADAGKFAEWVQAVGERVGTVDAVSVDAAAFATYFQDNGADPAAVAQELGVAEALAEALANGGDVAVPLATWAAKVAGTPAHAGLADHVRLSPDSMTASEARQFEADFGEEVERAAAEAKASRSTPRAVILAEVRRELEAAGRAPEVAGQEAAVIAAGFVTMAERAGMDPLLLWAQRKPAIRRVLPQALQGLTDADLDALLGREAVEPDADGEALGRPLEGVETAGLGSLYREAIEASGEGDADRLGRAIEAIESAGETVPPALVQLRGRLAPDTEVAPIARTSRAFTPDGQAIDVAFEVVELGELIASNTADLAPNPAFPAALQPRDRTRAASGEQVARMAGGLLPELLGESANASDGAPIVGPDGVVESGNGRVLALGRAYSQGMASAGRYRAWLEGQGYSLDGMAEPVLIRRRTTPLDDGQRQAFARAANVRTTASMSAAEQARADAAALSPDLLAMIRSNDLEAASNRPFAMRFLEKIAGRSELGQLIDKGGKLSLDGRRRMRGALLQRAYGDIALVERLLEEDEGGLGSLGRALLDAAPEWARLGDEEARAALVDAVRAVVRQRDTGNPLHFALEQSDAFGGGLSPDGRAFLAAFLHVDPKTGRSRLLSRVRLRKLLEAVAEEVERQGETGAASLLEGEAARPSVGQMVAAVDKRAKRELGEFLAELGLDPETATAADIRAATESGPAPAPDRTGPAPDGAEEGGPTLFQRQRGDDRTGDLFAFAEAAGALSAADRAAFAKLGAREPLTDAETAGLIVNGWAEADGQALTEGGARVLEQFEAAGWVPADAPAVVEPEPLGAPQRPAIPREQRLNDGRTFADLVLEEIAGHQAELAGLEAKGARLGKRQRERVERLERLIAGNLRAIEDHKAAMAGQAPVTFFQDGADPAGSLPLSDPRGSITFGSSGRSLIQLFERADLSTVLHETGHLFVDLLGDLASRPDAPEAVKADFQALLSFVGVASRDQLWTVHQETLARAFEAYLLEGRAPSLELQGAFARFRAWLIAIYRTMAGLNVELSDDVRAVFDRMLATDQAIAEAEAAAGFSPVFATGEAGGMTPAEHAAYLDAARRATDEAAARLERDTIDALARQKSQEWADAEARIRPEVEAEVDRRPAYRALWFFGRGLLEGEDVPPLLQGIKLARGVIRDEYGAEAVAALDAKRSTFGPLLHSEGVHPDDVADFLGFGSGQSLVAAMAAAPDRAALVEAETQRRVRDQLGDPLAPHELARAAQEQVHGDARAAFLALELKALSAKVGQISMPLKVIRAAALRAVGRETVRDLMGHDRHLYTSRRMATEAQRAVAKGDFRAAAEAKRRQLFHFEAWKVARTRHREVEKALDRWKRIAAGRVKMPADYRDQAMTLLERFDVRRASASTVAKRKGLDAWIQEQEANGVQVDIPERLRRDASKRHYSELTADDFLLLRDAIAHIEHLGRLKGKLMARRDAMDFEAAVAAIEASVLNNARGPVLPPPPDFGPKRGELPKALLRKLLASHAKLEFIFERLDGFKLGPVWDHLFRPLAEAQSAETVLQLEFSQKLGAILRRYSAAERYAMHRKRLDVPELGQSFTKGALLSLALNWGNEGNRLAILKGYKWQRGQVQAALDRHLTAADWQTVQALWDLIDELWPQIEQLQKDLTGLAPAKVEAAEVTTPHGKLRGGYYPLIYDSDLSFKAFQREEKQATQELFGGNFTRPATRKGHTIERVGSGGQPVRLDLAVLPSHLAQVIKDLTHRRAVIDVARLAGDERVRAAIEGAAGREAYRLIRPWLQNIAAPAYDPGSGLEAFFARARSGTTITNMGLKVTTMLAQPLGILTTPVAIGPKWALHGLATVYRSGPVSLRQSRDIAYALSPELRNRQKMFDRDVADTVRRLTKEGPLSPVQRFYFFFTAAFDQAVSLPTWHGAFQKAMSENPANEAAAVAYADSVVRMTQSAGGSKDLALVQRGPEYARMFTMFYSYFSVLFNQFERSVRMTDFRKVADYPRFLGHMTALWFVPAVLGELFAGRGPDEDEEWLAWAAKTIAVYPAATVVLGRDIVNAAVSPFGYELSPVAAAFEGLARLPGDLYAGNLENRGALMSAWLTASIWLHIPGRQLWITGEGFWDWLVHGVEPEGVGDALRHLLLQRRPPDERPG